MPQPTKIPRAFADSGDKNAIPDSSGSPGFASWQEGFPQITSEPFANGGIAPKRADFNGIFNAISLATVWQQQGGVYEYDNLTDYEVGNLVEYSGDIYLCLVANGPNSAVKAPTDATIWSKFMTFADDVFTSTNCTVSSSTGAIPYKYKLKFANGAMIQGYYDQPTTDSYSRITWTYDEAFLEDPFPVVGNGEPNQHVNLHSWNKTKVILRVNDMSGNAVGNGVATEVIIVAIGRWK